MHAHEHHLIKVIICKRIFLKNESSKSSDLTNLMLDFRLILVIIIIVIIIIIYNHLNFQNNKVVF